MEDEKIFSGYCRAMDQSRMVTVELTGGRIDDVDCLYPGCTYAPNCPIARKIDELVE